MQPAEEELSQTVSKEQPLHFVLEFRSKNPRSKVSENTKMKKTVALIGCNFKDFSNNF